MIGDHLAYSVVVFDNVYSLFDFPIKLVNFESEYQESSLYPFIVAVGNLILSFNHFVYIVCVLVDANFVPFVILF